MDAFLRNNKFLAVNVPYNIKQSFWHFILVLEKVLQNQEKAMKMRSATPKISKLPDKPDKKDKKEKKQLAAIPKATKVAAIEDKKKKKDKPSDDKTYTCFDCGKKDERKHHKGCPRPDEPNEEGKAALKASPSWLRHCDQLNQRQH